MNQEQGNRIFPRIAVVAMLIVLAMAGLIMYWSLSGGDVLEIKNEPVPVRSIRDHPQADGVVILNFDYCKLRQATGRVRTSFVSESHEIFLPIGEDKQPPQCLKTEVPILIPKNLPPGKYHVHFRVTYAVNPIKRDVVEEFDSKEFEVVDGNVQKIHP